MESVLRDVVFDSEAPTLAKPLSHSVNEQASLEKNRALHHLKQNGETEFLGPSRVSGASLTPILARPESD